MKHEDLPPVDGADGEACDESEVARVFDAYLAELEAGRPVDRARMLEEHPGIADQLRDCLDVMQVAEQLADASGAVSGENPTETQSPTVDVSSRSSLLESLGLELSDIPRVLLRELTDEPEPMLKPRSAAMPSNGEGLGRYQFQGEIARGGMGVVLKGRDIDLGRDLAIKVLLASHQGRTDVVRRFVEEAQIGGQLQHPGIVPVYELGTFPDRRPYFAMKLVKGRTLASLLQARSNPQQDLQRFLGIFEQVCQTMAYAHTRGVIHRDLKPSNIMVGSFGEVQVMDWGLAKVLAQGGIADEGASKPDDRTLIMTVRSGSAGGGSDSQAGSVLGTPAYMAPEQARGELELVDERADVFGLGAILCEILTGRPPFAGSSREAIRAQAARGDLADALGRLGACGADIELTGLARDCLAATAEARPRDAGEVTRRISAYQSGVEARLKAAELARVEAQTRAEEEAKRRVVADELAAEAEGRAAEERKRRRLTVALAASVLGLFVVGGGASTYLYRQRLERNAQIKDALGDVERRYADALHAGDDSVRWTAAREVAHALERLLTDATSQSKKSRLGVLVQTVMAAATAAENDRVLLAALAEIRSAGASDLDYSAFESEFTDAFRGAHIDFVAMDAAEVGSKLLARPGIVRVSLAAALDYWAVLHKSRNAEEKLSQRLVEVSRMVDPDPWRNRLRALICGGLAAPDRVAAIKYLASSARVGELPVVSLQLLGVALRTQASPKEAERLLRGAQLRYPSDPWLNLELARCLSQLGRDDEAIRYYIAARAVRPTIAHELAHALDGTGETDEAIAIFEDLARLNPTDGSQLCCFAAVLKECGRGDDAKRVFGTAATLARAAIQRDPGRWVHQNTLGAALVGKGDLANAADALREAIRIRPTASVSHHILGQVLRERGKIDEAIAECRTAVRLEMDSRYHNGLGVALSTKGSHDAAIAEFRTAIRLKPGDALIHTNLGTALREQGKAVEAVAECRTAIRLNSRSAVAHGALARALFDLGKLDEAIAEWRTAIRLKPEHPEAYRSLGVVYTEKGKLAEAIALHREALRLKPEFGEAHNSLGVALSREKKFDEAMTEFRAAIAIKDNDPEAHCHLGTALVESGSVDIGIAEIRAAIRLRPDYAEAYSNLGASLAKQGKRDEAIVAYRTAIHHEPKHYFAHANLAEALLDEGKTDEAIAECRAALRLRPTLASAHRTLGRAFVRKRSLDDAIGEFGNALLLAPEDAYIHELLASVFIEKGDVDRACDELHAALERRPDSFSAQCNLGVLLSKRGMVDEAILVFRKAIQLKPHEPAPYINLGGLLCDVKRDYQGAIAQFHMAIRLGPENALAHYNLGIALAAAGDAKDAISEFQIASRLKPSDEDARVSLGEALLKAARVDEAIDELRNAIRLNPNCMEAHAQLGLALNSRREYTEALGELRKASDLAKTNSSLAQTLGREIVLIERSAALAARLPLILRGNAKPADAVESLAFAQMCYDHQLHGASARLWEAGLKAQPALAEDLQSGNRYNAVCAAALAGCGQGKDDPPLDEAARSRWRKQALDWLKTDLAAWSKVLESGPPQQRQVTSQTLQHWKADPDLAGIRELAALGKLHAEEQKACAALWADVDALLKKAQGGGSQ